MWGRPPELVMALRGATDTTYRADGLVKTITTPAGTTSFEYDARGRVELEGPGLSGHAIGC